MDAVALLRVGPGPLHAHRVLRGHAELVAVRARVHGHDDDETLLNLDHEVGLREVRERQEERHARAVLRPVLDGEREALACA